MAYFWTAAEGLFAFELIVSRLFVIAHAAFSLPVTAWRRVQSGSE